MSAHDRLLPACLQVQHEQQKRKPDVIVNGVKLHRMHLMVQGQRIPFFYCSQKRITSQGTRVQIE